MKKSLFLLVILCLTFTFIGCANKPWLDEYEVLSVEEISGKKIEITFMVRSGIVSKALEEVLVPGFKNSQFYIDNGLDIDVKVVGLSGTYDTLRETIMLDINSNQAPDLIIGYPDHFAEYYSASALIDLTGFIEDKSVGYSKTEMEDFLESYLDENRNFDEKYPSNLFGLPFNKSTEVLIYNKTVFETIFGTSYLSKVPETWDQVESVGREIKEEIALGKLDSTFVKEIDPATGAKTYLKVSDYLTSATENFIPFGYDSSDNAFITFAHQFKGNYTERGESIEKGYITFDNKQVKDALAYFKGMTERGYFGNATSFGESYCSTAVANIQCVMTVGSSAGVGYNASNNSIYDYELGVAPIPYYTADAKSVIQQGTNIAMLNQNTNEEKLAAWLFMKYLLEPEQTAEFAITTGGYLPVRRSAYDTVKYKEFLNNPTDDQINFSAVANTALKGYIEKQYTFFVDDAFVGSAEIRSEAGKIFDSVVILGGDIEERIKKAYNNLSPYVKK